MINKPLLRKWIKALRSNQYQQGTRQLRSITNQYCCLGVLCDLSPKVTWEESVSKQNYSARVVGSKYPGLWSDIRVTTLPMTILNEIGIPHEDEHTLIELNDSGVSFIEIAYLLDALYLWD